MHYFINIDVYAFSATEQTKKKEGRERLVVLWTIVFFSLFYLFLRKKFTTNYYFILTSFLIQTDTHCYSFSCIVIEMSRSNSHFQPYSNTLPLPSETRSSNLSTM
jgi:hypothetical protein